MLSLFLPLPTIVKRLAMAVRVFLGRTIYFTYGLQLTHTAAAYRYEGKIDAVEVAARKGTVWPKTYWSFPGHGFHMLRVNWGQPVPDSTFRPARTLKQGEALYIFLPRRHRKNLYRRVQVGRFIRMTDDDRHGALKTDFGFQFHGGCPVYTAQGHIVGLVYGNSDHGPQSFFHRPKLVFFTPIEDVLAVADQIEGRTAPRDYSMPDGALVQLKTNTRTTPDEDDACAVLGLPPTASKADILAAGKFLLDHFGSEFDDDPPEISAQRRQHVTDALERLKKHRRC